MRSLPMLHTSRQRFLSTTQRVATFRRMTLRQGIYSCSTPYQVRLPLRFYQRSRAFRTARSRSFAPPTNLRCLNQTTLASRQLTVCPVQRISPSPTSPDLVRSVRDMQLKVKRRSECPVQVHPTLWPSNTQSQQATCISFSLMFVPICTNPAVTKTISPSLPLTDR